MYVYSPGARADNTWDKILIVTKSFTTLIIYCKLNVKKIALGNKEHTTG